MSYIKNNYIETNPKVKWRKIEAEMENRQERETQRRNSERLWVRERIVCVIMSGTTQPWCFVCLYVCLSSGRVVWKSSHLLDDCLMGAVVFAQHDPAGVLGGVMLVQPVQKRHVQIPLPRKLAVHKRTELQGHRRPQSHNYMRYSHTHTLDSQTSSQM